MRQLGFGGFKKDEARSNKEFLYAASLGSREACTVVGHCYKEGDVGIEKDIEMSKYYYQLGAVKGCPTARVALAHYDADEGDLQTAVRHLMIACRRGSDEGLQFLGELYRRGLKKSSQACVTKDQYAEALRTHKDFVDLVSSKSRIDAAKYSKGLKSMFRADLGPFFEVCEHDETDDSRDDEVNEALKRTLKLIDDQKIARL